MQHFKLKALLQTKYTYFVKEMKYLTLIAALFLVAHSSWVEMKMEPVRHNDHEKSVGEIWSNCTKTSDRAQIIRVTITPDPPRIGQNVTIRAEILFKEEVTGGKIAVTVKLGIIPIHLHFDLCESLEKAGLSCPIPKGEQRFMGSAPIPSLTLPGHYTGDATATDQNGDELGCVNFDLHLER